MVFQADGRLPGSYSSVEQDAGFVRRTLKFCDALSVDEYGAVTSRGNGRKIGFYCYMLREFSKNLRLLGGAEEQMRILRLTTPALHPKEQRALFGNPGTEKRLGPVRSG